ncbi:MAG TPA: nitroreductase family protein [Anaerolineales bacterium]
MSSNQDYQDFIRSRRSVRRFLPDRVPQELLVRVLQTAAWAPSAHNRQPWRFVELDSALARERLALAMGQDYQRDLHADGASEEQIQARLQRSRQRITEAPAAILLCLETDEIDRYPDEHRQHAEYLMAVQSVAMAGQNLLLAAHAEGLGGVWMCAPLFAQEAARGALNLPESWQPQALVLLGYPAKVSPPRIRREMDEVVLHV